MGNPNPRKEFLKPFEKGHARVGGMKKGQKTFATIMKEQMAKLPSNFLMLNEEGKIKMRALEKMGIANIKELITYQQLQKASKGDLASTAFLVKQTGEDLGDKLTVTQTTDDPTNLTEDQYRAILDGRADFDTYLQPKESAGGTVSTSEEE